MTVDVEIFRRGTNTKPSWTFKILTHDLHISGLRKDIAVTKRPKIKRKTAKVMLVDFYKQNRAFYPKDIGLKREAMIDLICTGNSAEDAFNQVRSA